ncbi:hypothetical protein CLV59_101825 [Chitinophaga dinghuensis]|uniref:Uncharacterized protein n=1 Tax=Chitinophaga dinghuensis TaxID=1539050 RepID=A0A327WFC5_9BACT|nr:hypothetical protein CLV59_101825 [Chitinophaga dinghuensis]
MYSSLNMMIGVFFNAGNRFSVPNYYFKPIKLTMPTEVKFFDLADYVILYLNAAGLESQKQRVHRLLYYLQAWHLVFFENIHYSGKCLKPGVAARYILLLLINMMMMRTWKTR